MLFPTILTDSAVHLVVLSNLQCPSTSILFPLSLPEPRKHRYPAALHMQRTRPQCGACLVLHAKISRAVDPPRLPFDRGLEAPDRCIRCTVPLHGPTQGWSLCAHPLGCVYRDTRDATVLLDGRTRSVNALTRVHRRTLNYEQEFSLPHPINSICHGSKSSAL